jgi:hypothetical protein
MPKRFANPVWSTRLGAALLVCIGLLGWLSYHLLTYDYGPVAGGEPPGRGSNLPGAFALKPLLKIVDGRDLYGEPGVCAAFSLVNSGRSKLKVVNTRALTPLYEVKLLVRGPDGGKSPAPMTLQQMAAMRGAATTRKSFNPEEDTVVELLSGEALTRPIRLQQLYDLQRDGTYELTVTYQPAALQEGEGPRLAQLGAEEQPLSCSLIFELPLEAPQKKTATPGAEPRESVPGTNRTGEPARK